MTFSGGSGSMIGTAVCSGATRSMRPAFASSRGREQEPMPYQSERDPYRLEVAHFEQATYEAARGQLEAHLHH